MELKKSLRKKFLESRNKYSIKEQFIANNVIVKNTLDVINSLRNWKRNTLLVKMRFLSQIKLCVPNVDSILYPSWYEMH